MKARVSFGTEPGRLASPRLHLPPLPLPLSLLPQPHGPLLPLPLLLPLGLSPALLGLSRRLLPRLPFPALLLPLPLRSLARPLLAVRSHALLPASPSLLVPWKV